MSRPICTLRTDCRGCGSHNVRRFLKLGPTPLANSFLHSEQDFAAEESFPLDVYFCEDCSLIQLLDVVDPEVMFRDYIYTTGTSDTIAKHNIGYAAAVRDQLNLTAASLVVEVASNDGSLLKPFRDLGVRTLGIEPATNIAAMARRDGIETINEFFTEDVARKVRAQYGPASAVIGNNVLAHVDDTVGFLSAMRELLGPGGRAILEFPYGGEFLERFEYDTVYHEHLCYFSVTALTHSFRRAGLSLRRIDRVPVHGGSLRVWAASAAETGTAHAPEVEALAEAERQKGFTSLEHCEAFASRVGQNREKLLTLLRDLKSQGKIVAGYGAPAKGNTLLNYCGITTDLLPYTVDKNPLKVGTFSPGSRIPVLPVSTLLERQPDYVLILPWNFAEEIQQQQQEYARRGGRFIIPIPEPHFV
jgi:hypothetical protein